MMPIRIGILGAAKIAPKAVILPAAKNPDFTVQAVAARDVARARAFAGEHAIPHVCDGYAALIARDDIDLIYNPLPPAGHLEWTIAALRAGKAVLCEKPFAMNTDQAKEMVAAAIAAGKPLIEAFHNRFHALMRRAAAAAGEIGPLRRIEAVFEVKIAKRPGELRWLAEQGGGALMDLGCYCLHAMRGLTGTEPEVLSARCRIEDGVDAVTEAELRFPENVSARLLCSMVPDGNHASLTLAGENGSLTLDNFVALHNGGLLSVAAKGETRIIEAEGPSTYEAQLAHVGDVLLRGAAPETGGMDAVANMAAIEAIYAAAGHRALSRKVDAGFRV